MRPNGRKSTAFYVVGLIGLGIFLHFDAGWQTAKVEDDVIRSCERINLVRAEINERGGILRNFLNDAAETRERTAAVEMDKGQEREAKLNFQAAAQWRKWADDVGAVEIPNCAEVVRSQGLR